MFDLPDTTVVNRFIPKEKFYKKTAMNNKLRQLFTDEIEKITWVNKISPETLNVAKDEHMSELQIFEIQLKDHAVSNAVLRHIDSSIPYPIIYILRRLSSGDVKVITSLTAVKKQFGSKTKHNDFISTGWSRTSGKFILNGNKISHIYIGYIFQIAGIARQPYSDPKSAIERWERSQEAQKQIDAINKKIKSELSISKKQELARRRHLLEKEMHE